MNLYSMNWIVKKYILSIIVIQMNLFLFLFSEFILMKIINVNLLVNRMIRFISDIMKFSLNIFR